MDLNELRAQIDCIDTEIQRLFEQRMDTVKEVADYKKRNSLPVYHKNREDEILSRIRQIARPEYADCDQALFTNLMDISKCSQNRLLQNDNPLLKEALPFLPDTAKRVVCQGVPGAYSHIAANRLFADDQLCFMNSFEDVFAAVCEGRADYGILPIENSSAGPVVEVYELLKRYDIYIARRIKVKIDHCLAALPGTKLDDIRDIYSHEQGLHQCSQFIQQHRLTAHAHTNTAVSAELVASSSPEQHIGAICSKLAADRNGLSVIAENIANIAENYTRFIVISKNACRDQDADIVSISFCLPHTPGSLYRMLTKFFVYGINMQKIESKPIGNKDFDIMFYIDFTGNLAEDHTAALLNDLAGDLIRFKYLGNYSEI